MKIPWSDCKVAFDITDLDNLGLNEIKIEDMLESGKLNKMLPNGWIVDGIHSSSTHCMIIFRIEGKLTIDDGKKVKKLLKNIDRQ